MFPSKILISSGSTYVSSKYSAVMKIKETWQFEKKIVEVEKDDDDSKSMKGIKINKNDHCYE